MEGTAKNFRKVLADFQSRLHGADFVAIDTELTGVDLEGEPDTFEESAEARLDKNCRIAEKYSLIQVGLTVVGRSRNGTEHYTCASYNLFAFPYMDSELGGVDPCFSCQASALRFNAAHRVNFNTWIGEGIPFMSREDEQQFFGSASGSSEARDDKIGLLKLWKALCAARLPLVVHTPKDLFFLLSSFERRSLPRDDPKALAALVQHCFPQVYDTAHLHGVLGRFKRLGLLKFVEDAKLRYDELDGAPPITFDLAPATAQRYGRRSEDELAHEAGFDSLMTAQLFAYLRAISATRVGESVNRLFLFRSVEYLDLASMATGGPAGTNMFDLSRVTLLVAVLDPHIQEAPRLIAASGSVYKWMDSRHILVVLRASGGAAVRKAAELASKVPGVLSWMGFEEWRTAQAAFGGIRHGKLLGFEKADGDSNESPPGTPGEEQQGEAQEVEPSDDGLPQPSEASSRLDVRAKGVRPHALSLLAAGASALVLYFYAGRGQLLRWLLRRWKRQR